MNWYQYPITVPHGGTEDGVDLGTPNDTPLTALYGGKVIDARYYPWGGQVFMAVPGTNFSEGYLHLDQINVQPGQMVAPGQQIGTSGGGVGDYLEKNGQVVRATSQADFGVHSSGYHMEYDLFQGQDINTVEMAVGNPARQIDPTSVIASVAGGSGPAPGAGATPGMPALPGTGTPTGYSGLPTPAEIAGGLGLNIDWKNVLTRLGVGILGIALVISGVVVAAGGNPGDVATGIGKGVAKAVAPVPTPKKEPAPAPGGAKKEPAPAPGGAKKEPAPARKKATS